MYAYSLPRRVTLEVLSLNSYALKPTILPLLEIDLEILLCNRYHCHRQLFMSSISRNVRPFKEDFILQNSQKSFGDKAMEYFSNRILDQKMLEREHLVSWNIVMVDNRIVGPKFGSISMHSFT
jgi:hypothetical protein